MWEKQKEIEKNKTECPNRRKQEKIKKYKKLINKLERINKKVKKNKKECPNCRKQKKNKKENTKNKSLNLRELTKS